MLSNEAIELVESVLSNITESERWQYRLADIEKKKNNQSRFVDDNKLEEYRTGTFSGKKLDPKNNIAHKLIAMNRKSPLHQYSNNIIHTPFSTEEYKVNYPENKDLHDKINQRTTAKHEAACILIKALDTLLTE